MLVASIMLFAWIDVVAQNNTQKQSEPKERKVWIRLKSGEVLSGELVKMDKASVDFTVKGVMQSVSCDDLYGVMFVPPTPRPANASAPAPTPAPIQAQAQAKPQQEEAPAGSSQELPDRCVVSRTQPITLAGGQYKHSVFSNSLRDFRFRGAFNAHGGKISVYITDAENYANLINGKKFFSFYSAKSVTEGQFDMPFKQGSYHFVWWNDSRYDTRVVEAELCFVRQQ